MNALLVEYSLLDKNYVRFLMVFIFEALQSTKNKIILRRSSHFYNYEVFFFLLALKKITFNLISRLTLNLYSTYDVSISILQHPTLTQIPIQFIKTPKSMIVFLVLFRKCILSFVYTWKPAVFLHVLGVGVLFIQFKDKECVYMYLYTYI